MDGFGSVSVNSRVSSCFVLGMGLLLLAGWVVIPLLTKDQPF